MLPTILIITGWAYHEQCVRNLTEDFEAFCNVEVLTAAQVLRERQLPAADYIVGWSMGGMLAMELMPEDCEGLALISSTARFCATDGYDCGVPEKTLKAMIMQLKRDPDAVLAEFYKNAAHPHPFHTCTSVKYSVDELVAGLEYLLHTDLREKVPTIGTQTLIMHGGQDQIVPPSASEWLNSTLPNSSLETFATEGHTLLLDNFDDVIDSLINFLSE
ncbi:MAG: alpha/beta hydrolase [Kiritimatiellales bacterium]|nr:alpha/beta hydrolase [Kiritimatiellales bacterium]